eukprot:scaffold31443_cov35-Tisochrysis_lutea.AAC.1
MLPARPPDDKDSRNTATPTRATRLLPTHNFVALAPHPFPVPFPHPPLIPLSSYDGYAPYDML